jgi:hypothetical protein
MGGLRFDPVVNFYVLIKKSSYCASPTSLLHLSGSCTSVTAGRRLQSDKSGYDVIPSSSKRLGNKVPHTDYGPIAPG